MAKLNSKLLKDFMQEHNMTQKQVAKQCGVSVGVIQKILCGNGVLRGETIIKICSATKIKCDELLCVTL